MLLNILQINPKQSRSLEEIANLSTVDTRLFEMKYVHMSNCIQRKAKPYVTPNVTYCNLVTPIYVKQTRSVLLIIGTLYLRYTYADLQLKMSFGDDQTTTIRFTMTTTSLTAVLFLRSGRRALANIFESCSAQMCKKQNLYNIIFKNKPST